MSPFKHPKITYGLSTDKYDKCFLKEYIEDITLAIGLTRKPVGIKFIYTKEEFDKLEVKRPEFKLCYCCMVEKATRGFAFKSLLEDHICDGATTALGLEDSTEKIESGREYFSYNLYSTLSAARRTRENVPGLYKAGSKTYGVLVMPFEDFNITPDVIIFICNPYQAMRIQQGYVYHIGGRVNMTGASMQGICVEATVEPYLKGRMNLTPLCPSTRYMAKWKDEEMAVGLPYEKFIKTVEGVMATINSTDISKRKKEIVDRFKNKGKYVDLDLS
ncbi:DUF169 domain-containing protein [Clostridium oceanicum]|uniref:DUF169 domain-containing protein n=1 Tax=Clostridium oceanicum TaxID=1543 RepID=A0ABN1JET5_9CLOT